jgi:aryl-alcohol dehydrogenase-like predicted oxidoreductase
MARVGLGTAQFGTRYGISNNIGQPDEAEVGAILRHAVELGVGYLDTAASYGTAEELIGKHLPVGHNVRIVTKLPPLEAATIGAQNAQTVVKAIANSRARLKLDRLHGALIHQARDLAKPGWQYIAEALREAQTRGWILRIGASVYDVEELALVEDRLRPDLVQLPFNAVDRRLIASGSLDVLKALGVEIHARSVFLQGLLLMEPGTIPSFFEPVLGQLTRLRDQWKAAGLSPLAGCLLAAFQQRAIDVVLVGVNRLSELREIGAAITDVAGSSFVLRGGAPVDPRYIDPRNWPATAH